MKLGVKIGSFTALVGLFLVGAAGTALRQVDHAADAARSIAEEAVPGLEAAADLASGVHRSQAAAHAYALEREYAFQKEGTEAWSNQINPALVDLGTFAAIAEDPAITAEVATLTERLAKLRTQQQGAENAAEGESAAFLASSRATVQQLTDSFHTLTSAHENHIEKSLAAAESSASFAAVVQWTLLVAGLMSFTLGGFLLSRSISRPVALTSQALTHLANGDLTHRLEIDRNDELGEMARTLDHAMENLCQLMSNVGTGADEIDRGSDQISSASQQLSSSATESASSLEEISASLEEISSMVGLNSENSQNANRLSDDATVAASRGAEEMKNLAVAMKEISDSSAEIAKIINVIDEIAFQTNLLALNAAVEAARAGEAGKGFAVVAEEVRALAKRSAEAARDTAVKIDAATGSAKNGTEIAQRVGEALDEIVSGVGSVNNILQEIATASTEQSRGIEQVTDGVTSLDKVTQMTAANAEELAATAEESSGQVSSLKGLISRFRFEAGQAFSPADFSLEQSGSPEHRAFDLNVDDAPAPRPAASSFSAPALKTSSAPSLIPMDEDEEEAFGFSAREMASVHGESPLASDSDLEEF